MEYNPQNNRYEQLNQRLLVRAHRLHNRSKKIIKYGRIGLIILPAILVFLRWLTDSDKVVCLLLWVFCLFALAVFLIGVEYLDHIMQKELREITESDLDEEFDELLPPPEQVKEKIAERSIIRRSGKDGDA